MRCRLASFLIGGVISFVVGNVVCPLLPINHKNPSATILVAAGSFFLFWWVSYIAIIQVARRRSDKDRINN